jgi:ribosomal protein S13|tara:strand:- start:8740 stop:9090 length:351 start_codon:yes stop_codon:yes gene_type:complete
MVIFFNKEFNNKQKLVDNLKQFYGVGSYSIKQIFSITGLNNNVLTSVGILKKQQVFALSIKHNNPVINNKLNYHVWLQQKRLLFIYTNRGVRNFFCLPTRGQRTKTNNKTVKKCWV